jgi:RNA polymerase-interacting CarD/CdnL/TRCF family regulator
MCEVMRDLNAQLARRPLTQYEKNLLKHTSEAVISEWSIASGISQDEARTEIEGYINKGQEFSTSK